MSPNIRVVKIEKVLVCRIIERLNRFVILVSIDGKEYSAHINSTGRLREFLVKDRKAFCIRQEMPQKTGVKIKSMGLFFNPNDFFIYIFNPDLKTSL